MLTVVRARPKEKAWMCSQEIGCVGVVQHATLLKDRLAGGYKKQISYAAHFVPQTNFEHAANDS